MLALRTVTYCTENEETPYRRFHRFSIGNQILAAVQLHQRDLPLSPIASFNRWKELGRSVCKGQKAISLWMPLTVKRRDKDDSSGDFGDTGEVFTVFKLAPRWFSLEQTEGEAHIFFKSQIVRSKMFYASPKPVKQLKLNQFLKVEPPPDEYLMKLQKQMSGFKRVLDTNDFSMGQPVASEELDLICKTLQDSTIDAPIERGVAALLAFHGHNEPADVEDIIEPTILGSMTIFTPLQNPPGSPVLHVSDVARFSESLLPINETRNYMMTIERLSGEKDSLSGNIANELIKDFQTATRYPPEEQGGVSAEDLTGQVQVLAEKIRREREAVKKNKASEEAV